jgi:cytochrome c2
MEKEHPEIQPHKYAQLMFKKGSKGMQWEHDRLQQMLFDHLNIIKKKMTFHPYLTPYTKANPKWITN